MTGISVPDRLRAVAVVLLALLVTGLLDGCASRTRVTRETVRFVREDEVVRARPVITVVSAPGPSSDALELRLTRKVFAPVYEADVTEEQARTLDLRNIFVIALGAVSGGMIRLRTTEGTTIVRGQPRRIQDLGEVEQPWAGGVVRVENGGATKELTSGADGVARARLAELVPATGDAGPVRLTVSAAIGAERESTTIELDRETVSRWRGR